MTKIDEINQWWHNWLKFDFNLVLKKFCNLKLKFQKSIENPFLKDKNDESKSTGCKFWISLKKFLSFFWKILLKKDFFSL